MMQKFSLARLIPLPRPYWAAFAIMLAILMSVINGTIINVALPTLSAEFGITPSSSIWMVNAYQLVTAVSLLSFASLGDLYGYKRMFLTGIAGFTAGSLLCALAGSFWMLVVTRVIQGLGAACIMSVNTALLRLIYPPEHLGRGMGLNAMVVAVSATAGPSVAGAILTFVSWHWLFLINIPFAIAAFIIGYKLLPGNPHREGTRTFDRVSSVANAVTFGLLIYSLEGVAHDANHLLIGIQVAVMLVVGYFFLRRQLRMDDPLFPVDLLRIPIFSMSLCTSVASFTAQMLALVSLPFFLQDVMDYSVADVGLMLTAWPVSTILIAPFAGRLADRFHPGLLCSVGLLVFAGGLFALYAIPPHTQEWNIVWRLVLCGLGFGLFQTPNNFTIVSSAPQHRSGGASGMLGTARLLGQTLGTSLVALLLRLHAHGEAVQFCLLIAGCCALAASAVSSVRMSQPAPNQRNHHI